MVDKRKLVDDPNTPYDDTKLVASISPSQARMFALTGNYESSDIQTEGWTKPPTPPTVPRPKPEPQVRRPEYPEAEAYGAKAGAAAQGYLNERKQLAPGVRRWGSETADPAEVYMTVDRNGNRVYTDNANFAARQSRGSLRRQDLAPGMTAADADRTLNDPAGGFTYAPASEGALKGLREANAKTRGGSRLLRQATLEAERAQAIADTRAGTRDIDKRREEQGQQYLDNLFDPLDDRRGRRGENIDARTMIALQKLGLDMEQFKADREDKALDREAAGKKDERDATKDAADLVKAVKAGEIDAADARDLIGAMPGEAGKRGGRSLRRALLQQLLASEDPWFLGEDEVGFADPSSIRRNPDGSGVYTEPDDGLFDVQRNIDLSPEQMMQIYGEDQDATAEDELEIRRRRGF